MSSKVIWYVHPYAGGPNVGRYDRPYHFCSAWGKAGVRSVIITANNHHLLDEGKNAGEELHGEVCYEFLPTPKYKGNGFGRLFNMASFSFSLLWSAKRLKRRYGKPNLIIYSSPHPYATVSVKFISLFYRAKTVFEVRDLWPLSLVELAGVSSWHPIVIFTSLLERFSYRSFDLTVSLLPCTLSYMKNKGLIEEKWRYIPNGVFINPHSDEQPLMDTDYSCLQLAKNWRDAGYFIITYTGALGKPNNIHTLIESLMILKNDRIKLLIVGRGDQEAVLRQKIADYDLSDQVFILEQVPKRVIQRLLSLVDVGYISLLPKSIFRFGVSPNKLYDYMQARLPVLFAVDSGNNPVLDANCGLTANPQNADEIADKISYLSTLAAEDLKIMGDNGFQSVYVDYNYKFLAQRYLELID